MWSLSQRQLGDVLEDGVEVHHVAPRFRDVVAQLSRIVRHVAERKSLRKRCPRLFPTLLMNAEQVYHRYQQLQAYVGWTPEDAE